VRAERAIGANCQPRLGNANCQKDACRCLLLPSAQVLDRRVQVSHCDAATADCVVEQELELCDRHAGLERERRVQVPQRVPDETAERVYADLGDVPARAVRRKKPGRVGVDDPVLVDPAANEVNQRTRQRQVERPVLSALRARHPQAAPLPVEVLDPGLD
jgi:hypothetical protein